MQSGQGLFKSFPARVQGTVSSGLFGGGDGDSGEHCLGVGPAFLKYGCERQSARSVLEGFLPSCEAAGLILSANSVKKLIDRLAQRDADFVANFAKQTAKEAQDRLYEELRARMVLYRLPL